MKIYNMDSNSLLELVNNYSKCFEKRKIETTIEEIEKDLCSLPHYDFYNKYLYNTGQITIINNKSK